MLTKAYMADFARTCITVPSFKSAAIKLGMPTLGLLATAMAIGFTL